MKLYMVTVKLPNNPIHDPRHKVAGECPAHLGKECTDTTGAHHTVLAQANDHMQLREIVRALFGRTSMHITRIEEV